MKIQEMFDQVATHLMKQGRKSLRNGSTTECAYLAENGDKCAAGCLIPPDKYNLAFEGEGVRYVPFFRELAEQSEDPRRFLNLLAALQMTHDHQDPSNWKKGLRELAYKYDMPLLDILKD